MKVWVLYKNRDDRYGSETYVLGIFLGIFTTREAAVNFIQNDIAEILSISNNLDVNYSIVEKEVIEG